MNQFTRICHDASIMGGKACIAGTRITVSAILMQLSEGATTELILAEYPSLTEADIAEVFRYTAWLTGAREERIEST